MTTTNSAKEEKGSSSQQQTRKPDRCNPFSSLIPPKKWSQQQGQQQAHGTQGSETNATSSRKEEKGSPSQQQAGHDHRASAALLDRLSCLNSCPNELKWGKKQKENKTYPRNYIEILQNSDLKLLESPLYEKSPEMVIPQLDIGVFLFGRKQKYWVIDKDKNCFMIFANGLELTPKDDPECNWYVHPTKTSEHGLIYVAHLRSGSKLKVEGKFNTIYLSEEVTYKVDFLILLQYSSKGLDDAPMNLKLTLPNNKDVLEPMTQADLKEKNMDIKGQWARIPVGKVEPPHTQGDMTFSLYWDNDVKKEGLIIKGVIIEPIIPNKEKKEVHSSS